MNLGMITGAGIGVGRRVLLVFLLRGKSYCVGLGELEAELILAAEVDDRAAL